MTWEVLDFVFIFHWNENEIFPVFSQSRVVLIQECFFPPSNSDHFFSLVFSPEMTRKATLSIKNQKTAQVIKPLSDTVFTHTCAKTHDKRHNKAAAAFTSRSNTIWLLWRLLQQDNRCWPLSGKGAVTVHSVGAISWSLNTRAAKDTWESSWLWSILWFCDFVSLWEMLFSTCSWMDAAPWYREVGPNGHVHSTRWHRALGPSAASTAVIPSLQPHTVCWPPLLALGHPELR